LEPFCLEESDLPEGELRKTEIRQGPERRSHDVEARKGSRKGSTLLETALDGWSDRSDWLPFVFQAGSMVLAAMVIGEGHRWDTKNSPWDDTGMPLCTTDRKTGEASLLSWRVGEGVNASDVEKELELVWTFVDHIGPIGTADFCPGCARLHGRSSCASLGSSEMPKACPRNLKRLEL
jgi:hypothetical protein